MKRYNLKRLSLKPLLPKERNKILEVTILEDYYNTTNKNDE